MSKNALNKPMVTFLIGDNNTSSASFNRFFALAKATSIKQNIRVALIRPIKDKKETLKVLGELSPSSFIAKEKPRKYLKFLSKLLGIYISFQEINKFFKNELKKSACKEVLFLYSTNLIDYILYNSLAKKHGFRLVTERNEYPKLIREKVFIKTFFYRYLILPQAYRVFDGMIVMTEYLREFYTPYLKKETPVVKVPMTVDFERFNNTQISVLTEEYVFYAGSLIQQKDGIESLILAFLEVQKTVSDIKLKIAGGTNAEIAALKNKLSLKEDDRIEFMGLLPRKNIPSLLLNAKILMLPRPFSKQAEGGFPTKLGEYLAAGKPVIATPVGEIPNYLIHENDVVFCYDLNPSSLSKLILTILNNYDKYLELGLQGQITAKKHFNLINNVDSLHKFYKEV